MNTGSPTRHRDALRIALHARDGADLAARNAGYASLEELELAARQEADEERRQPQIAALDRKAAAAMAQADALRLEAEQATLRAAELLSERDRLTTEVGRLAELEKALGEMIDQAAGVLEERTRMLVEDWASPKVVLEDGDPYQFARHAQIVRAIHTDAIELPAQKAARKIVAERLQKAKKRLADVGNEIRRAG